MSFIGRCCCFIIIAGLISGCSKKKGLPKAMVPPVEVATVISATIPLYIEGIGHVTAFNSAEIKAQVEGELMNVYYEQGQDVEEGELLVLIDPRPYQAQLKEAEGTLIETKSNLKFAEDKVMRYSKLVDDNYVSQLNYDEFVTNVNSLLGSLKKNEGNLQYAKINLDYCYIKAPFSGRVGKKLIDQGNLIANDGQTLVLLNQIQPIYVDFTVPERDLLEIFRFQTIDELKVKLVLPNSYILDELGDLIVIDNQISQDTGMIQLRAQFANKSKLLWPGLFVKAQLILEEKQGSILVPEECLNLGQKGYYIYIVDQQKNAKQVPVKLGQRFGTLIEIPSGIQASDLVVVNGQFNIFPGEQVDIKSTSETKLPAILEGDQ